MKTRYQTILTYLGWAVAGILAIGSFFDAISNAVSIVTVPIALLGTILFVAGWPLVQQWLKRHPLAWVNEDGTSTIINKLNVDQFVPGVGMVLLLWVPVVLGLVKASRPVLAVSLPDPGGCEYRILPANLDPSRSHALTAEAVSQAMAIDKLASWDVPAISGFGDIDWGYDLSHDGDGARNDSYFVGLDLRHVADDDGWIHFGRKLYISLLYDEAPQHVNVIEIGCRDSGGGGEFRYYTSLSLDPTNEEAVLEPEYGTGFDYFSLSKGEMERLVLDLECKEPGQYKLQMNFPYTHEGKTSQFQFTGFPIFYCPQTYTLWEARYFPGGGSRVDIISKLGDFEWRQNYYLRIVDVIVPPPEELMIDFISPSSEDEDCILADDVSIEVNLDFVDTQVWMWKDAEMVAVEEKVLSELGKRDDFPNLAKPNPMHSSGEVPSRLKSWKTTYIGKVYGQEWDAPRTYIASVSLTAADLGDRDTCFELPSNSN